jgi:hypothetical protein
MFTFDTTDQKEARRFRIAQFNGRVATVKSDGSTITGHAHSDRAQDFGGRPATGIAGSRLR